MSSDTTGCGRQGQPAYLEDGAGSGASGARDASLRSARVRGAGILGSGGKWTDDTVRARAQEPTSSRNVCRDNFEIAGADEIL